MFRWMVVLECLHFSGKGLRLNGKIFVDAYCVLFSISGFGIGR